jgi:hypothetical protein
MDKLKYFFKFIIKCGIYIVLVCKNSFNLGVVGGALPLYNMVYMYTWAYLRGHIVI